MANYSGPTSITTQRDSGSAAGDRQRLTLDNLLRRELHVGDPSDPAQIAQALAERYQNNVRMQAIDGEARGLPFLSTPMLRPVDITTPTATNVDLEQSRSDVNTDMQKLLSDNQNKDIRPELEGWQTALNRSIEEGVAAARQGLDSVKRDTAFAMRRQLGEYARLSRMVGAATPALNTSFRDLAQSIDEVCSVILVLMGESMANVGFAGGRYLLQAPYSELQARRDAVLNAIRQVEGVSQNLGGWPRGMSDYRQLYTLLEAKGEGDIRSLLAEGELARTMDELVQIAGAGSPNSLRALGATAWAPLNRLTRFVQTTVRHVNPNSPELATLLEALQLFIEGFGSAGGFRLLRVARPTVLNYGLYGYARITRAEQRLINLVNARGTLASLLDCVTDCECEEPFVLAQIVLDKMLYDIDRAVDLYCAGDADLGLPEVRAAACSHMLDVLIPVPPPLLPAPAAAAAWPVLPAPAYVANVSADISLQLDIIRRLLRPIGVGPGGGAPENWDTTELTYNNDLSANLAWLGGAVSPPRFAQMLHDELCLQQLTDQQWRPVFEQMTSGCVSADHVFGANGVLPGIVHAALVFIQNATAGLGVRRQVAATCQPLEPRVPRDPDETLQEIARKI